jgi:bifunctional DNA-binding transcriptional regulator/antitoxin component of YhaV-PrlF toxin-antitoxin module
MGTALPGAVLEQRSGKTISYVHEDNGILEGQIVWPAELRQQDHIEAGQEFEVERLDRGDYRLVRVTNRLNEVLSTGFYRAPKKGSSARSNLNPQTLHDLPC